MILQSVWSYSCSKRDPGLAHMIPMITTTGHDHYFVTIVAKNSQFISSRPVEAIHRGFCHSTRAHNQIVNYSTVKICRYSRWLCWVVLASYWSALLPPPSADECNGSSACQSERMIFDTGNRRRASRLEIKQTRCENTSGGPKGFKLSDEIWPYHFLGLSKNPWQIHSSITVCRKSKFGVQSIHLTWFRRAHMV